MPFKYHACSYFCLIGSHILVVRSYYRHKPYKKFMTFIILKELSKHISDKCKQTITKCLLQNLLYIWSIKNQNNFLNIQLLSSSQWSCYNITISRDITKMKLFRIIRGTKQLLLLIMSRRYWNIINVKLKMICVISQQLLQETKDCNVNTVFQLLF